MSNRLIVALKVLVHAACFAPLAWLTWGLLQNRLGADPTSYVTHFSGFGALRILVLSLAITPVRKLLPQFSWLIRFRRLLGLWAFAYASVHLLIYISLFAGFSWPVIADDLTKRRYIWAGVTSWLLLLPLALSSTAWAIRKLGGKPWQRLHRIVYLACFAGIVHYWWIVKTGVKTPVTVTVIFLALMLARPLLNWRDRLRKQRRPLGAAAAR
jgi:methionine sulfoxide reductase heme-binding subunit